MGAWMSPPYGGERINSIALICAKKIKLTFKRMHLIYSADIEYFFVRMKRLTIASAGFA